MVKSQKKETLLEYLKETFDNLPVYEMNLNPTKCVFGIPTCKLLGFLVSEPGIEANSDKIKAITSLGKPADLNQVERMVGRIAALSQFISHLGEKAIPPYQLLEKMDNFVWIDAANEAFEDLVGFRAPQNAEDSNSGACTKISHWLASPRSLLDGHGRELTRW